MAITESFEMQKRLEEQAAYRMMAKAAAMQKSGAGIGRLPMTSAGGYAAGGISTTGRDLEIGTLRAANAKMSERLDEAARMADKVGCAVKTITRLFEDQHIGGKAEAEEQLCEALAMLTVAMRQAEQTMDEVIPF